VQRDAHELVGRERILAVAADHDLVVQREQLRPDVPAAEQFEIRAHAARLGRRGCRGYVRCRFHRHAILVNGHIVQVRKTPAPRYSSQLI
jgi:hypothetical protein